MKEKIYTVPVNDAFALDSECPICSMFEKLENDAVEYAMGPSYMEDDIREKRLSRKCLLWFRVQLIKKCV